MSGEEITNIDACKAAQDQLIINDELDMIDAGLGANGVDTEGILEPFKFGNDLDAQIKLRLNNCDPKYYKGIMDHPEEELLKKSFDWVSNKAKNAVKNIKNFLDDIQAPTPKQMQTFRHSQGKGDVGSNILETIKFVGCNFLHRLIHNPIDLYNFCL